MIKVFSADNCVWCTELKAYLDSRRVEYDIVDVGESRENYDRLISISGQSGVPVTLFGNGEVVIGFDRERIDRLL